MIGMMQGLAIEAIGVEASGAGRGMQASGQRGVADGWVSWMQQGELQIGWISAPELSPGSLDRR